MTVNTLFQSLLSSQTNGEALFLATPDGLELSYSDLRIRVRQAAGQLRAAGVAPGDRVLCQIDKSPDGLILYLATVTAGGVFVPLNTAYTAAELDYFLSDAEPAALITGPMNAPARAVAQARMVSVLTPAEIVRDCAPIKPVARSGSDLAAILYTSGTTGRSKGAMLTHDNLVSNAFALRDCWRFTADDTLLHALPIFHTHGLFVATNVVLAAGAKMIFLDAFSLDALAPRLHECSVLMGVPTFYTRMLGDDRFDRAAMSHMRLIISGSAPLLAETHAAFQERTGHRILERYGMTETNMITSNSYDGARKAGTVGLALPGVSVRIGDPDDRGIGAIEVKGPNVTPGYWRNPWQTAENFTRDGWFITGDLGRFDDDGYLSIIGREKDLVISGGFNIYPKEVEEQIDALPGVLECAVYGVPHPDMGEAVAAAVVLKSPGATTESEILSALGESLARFKIPRMVRFVDELPRNTMGKVQKVVLRSESAGV
ncbi:MAG: malonyl-CoA synthase [Salinarimonadaceae bacterium]|nr:MAG: malonyl-CoA synthase [Salinarimonadaceae bacterium]